MFSPLISWTTHWSDWETSTNTPVFPTVWLGHACCPFTQLVTTMIVIITNVIGSKLNMPNMKNHNSYYSSCQQKHLSAQNGCFLNVFQLMTGSASIAKDRKFRGWIQRIQHSNPVFNSAKLSWLSYRHGIRHSPPPTCQTDLSHVLRENSSYLFAIT